MTQSVSMARLFSVELLSSALHKIINFSMSFLFHHLFKTVRQYHYPQHKSFIQSRLSHQSVGMGEVKKVRGY